MDGPFASTRPLTTLDPVEAEVEGLDKDAEVTTRQDPAAVVKAVGAKVAMAGVGAAMANVSKATEVQASGARAIVVVAAVDNSNSSMVASRATAATKAVVGANRTRTNSNKEVAAANGLRYRFSGTVDSVI